MIERTSDPSVWVNWLVKVCVPSEAVPAGAGDPRPAKEATIPETTLWVLPMLELKSLVVVTILLPAMLEWMHRQPAVTSRLEAKPKVKLPAARSAAVAVFLA